MRLPSWLHCTSRGDGPPVCSRCAERTIPVWTSLCYVLLLPFGWTRSLRASHTTMLNRSSESASHLAALRRAFLLVLTAGGLLMLVHASPATLTQFAQNAQASHTQ